MYIKANNVQFKSVILLVLFLTVALVTMGCVYPSHSKSGTPADHTDSIGGVLHKPGSEDPFSQSSDCTTCHQADLRGGVGEVEGELRFAPSCYQCHEDKWSN